MTLTQPKLEQTPVCLSCDFSMHVYATRIFHLLNILQCEGLFSFIVIFLGNKVSQKKITGLHQYSNCDRRNGRHTIDQMAR